MRTWTADELSAFLESVSGDDLYAAWLDATTGLRRGELLGLHGRDLDLDRACACRKLDHAHAARSYS